MVANDLRGRTVLLMCLLHPSSVDSETELLAAVYEGSMHMCGYRKAIFTVPMRATSCMNCTQSFQVSKCVFFHNALTLIAHQS